MFPRVYLNEVSDEVYFSLDLFWLHEVLTSASLDLLEIFIATSIVSNFKIKYYLIFVKQTSFDKLAGLLDWHFPRFMMKLLYRFI